MMRYERSTADKGNTASGEALLTRWWDVRSVILGVIVSALFEEGEDDTNLIEGAYRRTIG